MVSKEKRFKDDSENGTSGFQAEPIYFRTPNYPQQVCAEFSAVPGPGKMQVEAWDGACLNPDKLPGLIFPV